MSCSALRLWAVELSKIGFKAIYLLRSTHREALWWSVLVESNISAHGDTGRFRGFVPCKHVWRYTGHVLSRTYHGTRGAVVMSSP